MNLLGDKRIIQIKQKMKGLDNQIDKHTRRS